MLKPSSIRANPGNAVAVTGNFPADANPDIHCKTVISSGPARNKGYHNQDEGGWMVHPYAAMVDRGLSTQFLPLRSQWDNVINDRSIAKLVAQTRANRYASQRHNYVEDVFGKIIDGTLIGDNLGNSIYANF